MPFTTQNINHSTFHDMTHGLFPRRFHNNREIGNDTCTRAENIHHNMALFDRSELVLGELLGNGAFCQVHELQQVQFNPSKVRHYFSRTWWDNKLHQTGRTREYIRQTCLEELHQGDQDTEDITSENDTTKTNDPKTTHRARYVVKHLRPNLGIERSHKVFLHAAADLRMEYEILSRLSSHSNIVQLKGGAIVEKHAGIEGPLTTSDLEKQDYFLILERLEETLSQRIHCWKRLSSCPTTARQWGGKNSSALPHYYLEKLRIARDIASALTYVHEQRLIFRDLKPDNVGLTADGRAKLIDFGLCRELPKTSSNECSRGKEPLFRMSGVGTRRYMAPEIILNRGYNQKIDCYSWAMVFYEMLCLQKPYASYNREVHKILVCENEDRPRPTADVPAMAQSLLERAWAQEPGDRLAMAEILCEVDDMTDSAERQAMTMHERSLKVVMEMAELFTVEDSLLLSGSQIKRDNSIISRKSTAELTVSTSTSTSSDFSILSLLR
jgi:serine/threonine protein kinase